MALTPYEYIKRGRAKKRGEVVPPLHNGPPKGYTQTEEHKTKKALAKRRGAFFACEICEKEFWRSPAAIKNGECRFCSKQCYQEWQRGRPKSEAWKAKKIVNNKNRASGYSLRKLYKFIRESNEYREWRKSVFERDDYTCQKCFLRSKKGNQVYIEAHHLKPFALFPEERFAIDNGVTLCKSCHDKEPKGKEIYDVKY